MAKTTVDDLGAIILAVFRDTHHDRDEQVRLVCTLLAIAEAAGIQESGSTAN